MFSDAKCSLFIRKCIKNNPKDPLLLYHLINSTITLESRIDDFMNDRWLDYKALTFTRPNNSKDLYGYNIPKPVLTVINNFYGTVNDVICKEYVFVILDKSLSTILRYALDNLELFCTKYFETCEDKVLEIFKALEYIHNQHGFVFSKHTYQGFIEMLAAKKCEIRYQNLKNSILTTPSFDQMATSIEKCIDADVCTSEMLADLSMAFQRNKIRYHRTRSKLLKQLPST